MTPTPAAVEALKLATALISSIADPCSICTGTEYKNRAAQALRHLSALAQQPPANTPAHTPPTGVSGAVQAKREPVALLTMAREDDPTWRGMNFIGLTEHGRTLVAGKYELYATSREVSESPPLTDEQIRTALDEAKVPEIDGLDDNYDFAVWRAAERHFGIGVAGEGAGQ